MWSLNYYIALLSSSGLLGYALPVENVLSSRQFNPLNPFLALFTNLPPVNLLVDGISSQLTNLESLLIPFAGGPVNQTDIASGKPCADVTVVFARGTTEPGNMGVVAGPQFVNAIKSALPGKTVNAQGVEYAAEIPAYLAGGGQDGTQSMTALVTQAITQCPNTKLVMSGYSQGAQVVHNTAKVLPADVMAKVNSVVAFGDPFNQTQIQGAEGKSKVFCHEGDNICVFGDLILPPHLTYGLENAQEAGAFVAQMVGAA